MNTNPPFDRLEYWNTIELDKSESIFDEQFTKCFKLTESELNSLKQATKKTLCHTLYNDMNKKIEWEEILSQINQTNSISVKKDWNNLLHIENLIIDFFNKRSLLNGICGIEFPVNVRVAHGKAPDGYLQKQFATDHYHTDLWAEEPEDILQVLIYIAGDVGSTYMEIYNPAEADLPKFTQRLDSYSSLSVDDAPAKKVNYTPAPGQVILFDGACPHQTVRNGSARVSLDLRLRRVDPYKPLSESWSKQHAPWSRYWSFNPERPLAGDFSQKCSNELQYLQQNRAEEAYQNRKVFIDNLKA